jgi:hypothetical protein
MEKSKNILEKFKKGTIGHNIGLLMQKTHKSYFQIESEGGLSNGALKKWMDKKLDFSTLHLETFLIRHGLDKSKWTAGEVEFIDGNTTSVDKKEEIKENREEVYRNLVEDNTEYKLVPSELLNGEYRIILNRELEMRDRLLTEQISQQKEALSAKNELIQMLKDEIKDLQSMSRKQSQKTQ